MKNWWKGLVNDQMRVSKGRVISEWLTQGWCGEVRKGNGNRKKEASKKKCPAKRRGNQVKACEELSWNPWKIWPFVWINREPNLWKPSGFWKAHSLMEPQFPLLWTWYWMIIMGYLPSGNGCTKYEFKDECWSESWSIKLCIISFFTSFLFLN